MRMLLAGCVKTVCQSATIFIQSLLKFRTIYREGFPELIIGIFSFSLLAFSVSAHDWYVVPNGAGTLSGTNWSNATGINNIHWSSMSAGDTVWLAGGTYTSPLSITQNGVFVKRVLSSDAAPVAAAGWNSAFDSQVVFKIAGAGQDDITIGANNVRLDGQIWCGIQCVESNTPTDSKGCVISSSINNVVANVEAIGPQYNNFNGVVFNANATGFAVVGGTNNLLTNCWSHLNCIDFFQYHDSGVTLDHCLLSDCGMNAANGGMHSDLIVMQDAGNLVLRYCVVSNWNQICVQMWSDDATGNFPTTCGASCYYGNVFINPVGVQDVLWPQGAGQTNVGPLSFYNNTLYRVPVQRLGRGSVLPWPSGSSASNNIFYGLSCPCWVNAPANEDYEFADSTSSGVAGSHSISNGSNPFVNAAAFNFNIVSNIGATYPRNRGVPLNNVNGQTYNLDGNGTIRGADGAWDIGAYEYASTNASSGSSAQIFVSPMTINYGPVPAGTTVTNSFNVQNIGGGTLTGTASVSPPYNVVSGGTYSLASGQTNAVMVSYSPNGSPTNSTTVNFTASSGSGTNAIVVGSVLMPPPSGLYIY